MLVTLEFNVVGPLVDKCALKNGRGSWNPDGDRGTAWVVGSPAAECARGTQADVAEAAGSCLEHCEKLIPGLYRQRFEIARHGLVDDEFRRPFSLRATRQRRAYEYGNSNRDYEVANFEPRS